MSIINNAKEIAELIKKLDDVELYRKIVELEGEIIDITRTKHQLEEKVQELQQTLSRQEALSFKEPFYYTENDTVPFCPNCWENNNKSIHLFNNGYYQEHNQTFFKCNNCKTEYWYNGRHA